MRRRGIPVWVCCAATIAGAEAGAVPLLTGFGGVDGYGTPDHCVAAGNDNSYAAPGSATPTAIDLTPAFPSGLSLFGRAYDRLFLNTNGNVTFAAPLASPSPAAFPIADQPMIAPWWADVDTRAGGTICFHLEPTRLVATWHDVGAFNARSDRRNDFQMILTSRPLCEYPGEFDVEFRYHRCEWVSGDGTLPALVGFDAGNLRNYVRLPQSLTAAIADVCTTTNVVGGEPGLFRFRVRRGSAGMFCIGGGLPCVVADARGRCAHGVTGCVNGPTATCLAVRAPRARGCDGFDNDCDGSVDQGDELCGAGLVCDRAGCLPRCDGAARCPAGTTCTPSGGCLADACLGVDCAPGQRCDGGRCVDLCVGVACNAGERCFDGRCIPACTGVECDAPQVCDFAPESPYVGQCIARCECTPCPSGRVCGPDGRCVLPPPPDAGAPPDAPPVDAATADVTVPDAAPIDVVPTDDASPPGRLLDAGCGCRIGPAARPPASSFTAVAPILLLATLAPLRFLLRRRSLARRRRRSYPPR